MDKHLIKPYLHPIEPKPTHLERNGDLRMPIKCLMCDIYGTLLMSGSGDIGVAQQKSIKEATLAGLMAEYGIQQSPKTLRQELFKAIEKEHLRKQAAGTGHPEVEIDKIWAAILPFADREKIRSFAVLWEMVVNPIWPMPGLSNLIDACRNHGIALGIISNAQFYTPLLFEWLLESDLEHLGFDHRLIVLSFQHGIAKPSRFLFDVAADRLQDLGIAPGQAAFIGNDMRNDIVPARGVGFQTILFAGDARSLRLRTDDPDCRIIEPDLRITQLSQLTTMLIEPSTKTNI